MYKKIITGLFLTFTLILGSAFAEDITLKPGHPDEHVVVKGDTLWDISGTFLKDPWHWPNIWHANPQIENPHLIYPGDVIKLVYIDGKPQLIVQRGRPEVKLTPTGRIVPLHRSIPTIPLDVIGPFLSKPMIVGKDELDKSPYVVSIVGEHLISANDQSIYARGLKGGSQTNHNVVRTGNTYKDPVTKEILGYEAMYLGDGRLQVAGDPATISVTNVTREIRIGDRLLPQNDIDNYDANFLPHAPNTKVEGQILAVVDGLRQVGQNQVVVINRGTRENIEVGHVLNIFKDGRVVLDKVTKKARDTVKLPDEKAGTLMVFRTFERLSYALVMTSSTNMHVLDKVRSP